MLQLLASALAAPKRADPTADGGGGGKQRRRRARGANGGETGASAPKSVPWTPEEVSELRHRVLELGESVQAVAESMSRSKRSAYRQLQAEGSERSRPQRGKGVVGTDPCGDV